MLVYGSSYRPISVMEDEANDGDGGKRRYDSGKMRDTELKLAQPSSIFTKCIENSDDGTTHPIPATSTFLKLKVFFVNFPIQGKCLSLTICQMS
ncbi:unnamed protein product [Lactuca virosa]|uniref:Uncharacterized protein n=1 Tax=Lactuca virosa TaxID=75947 RepID=A0AAU9N1D5_9ASTR|nr:unnamed protein product [Lactuca virosa]